MATTITTTTTTTTQACTLVKDEAANVYTDSSYDFGVTQDFGILWKQHGFLTSRRNKIKNGFFVQELLDVIFY